MAQKTTKEDKKMAQTSIEEQTVVIPLQKYENLVISRYLLDKLRAAWQKNEHYALLEIVFGKRDTTSMPDPWDPKYDEVDGKENTSL